MVNRKMTGKQLAHQKWASREHDKYLEKENAVEDYRCRSAYKLLEIEQTYSIFKPGQTVVDLGCAPGSWTQVAVKHTLADSTRTKSLVVGMDLKITEPIQGATLIDELDFLDEDSYDKIHQKLKGRRADVLLSDMAPNTTGNRFVDHANVSKLCFSILQMVHKLCSRGATLVMKVFDGEECKQLLKDTRFLFESVRVVHPKATRKPSSEMFYVGFRYKNNILKLEDD